MTAPVQSCQQRGEEPRPIAWVVFAENGNVRLWGPDRAGPQAFADERGLKCEPVYRASVDVRAAVIEALQRQISDCLDALSAIDKNRCTDGNVTQWGNERFYQGMKAGAEELLRALSQSPATDAAKREEIARIIDPRAFIIENSKRFDIQGRQRDARDKAGAILALDSGRTA